MPSAFSGADQDAKFEKLADQVVKKGGNIGAALRRKDKVLITIPRKRRTFQDGGRRRTYTSVLPRRAPRRGLQPFVRL